MTADETFALLAQLAATWPGFQLPDDDADADTLVANWYRLCSHLDLGLAQAAVDMLACEGRRFAPGPGEVVHAAAQLVTGGPAPAVADAWAEVKAAIVQRGRMAPPSADDWSHPAIARVVDSLGWVALCNGTSEAVDRSNFARWYAEHAERVVRDASRPESVRRFIEAAQRPALAVSGDATAVDAGTVHALPEVEVPAADLDGALAQIRAMRAGLRDAG